MAIRHARFLMLVSVSLIAGCMSAPDARYVYQDGQYGVIGIPFNTSLGKKDYREQANELMLRHFPEGYEVVRAEEVVEGERTLDRAIKKELETEPGFAALNQALKLGKYGRSSSLDQKDTIHITESRIIYRRKDALDAKGHDGFAALATLGPELYLDPNDVARKAGKEMLLASKKDEKDKDKEKDKDRDREFAASNSKTRDDNVHTAGAVRSND